MPITTSALRQAVAARMAATGEVRRMAGLRLRDLHQALPWDGRRGAPYPVVPEGHTLEQWALEARLLQALGVSSAASHPRAFSAFPLRYVSPLPDRIELSLRPEVLDGFVMALVPRPVEGDVVGTPGVRAATEPCGITLTTLDSTGRCTTARAVLTGISARAWEQSLERVAQQCEPGSRISFIHDAGLAPSNSR